MKKSLLALAALGAFAGSAVAQSSVTLYGTVDVNGRFVKNDGAKRRLSLSTDGINSSQLGFRGIEDLGGGIKAGFTLLASVGVDDGDQGAGQGATGSGRFWHRRSTVSLFSGAGELRLGRDYVPTFWNQTIFDAFGTNGLGASTNIARYQHTRQDNSIGYFLPSNLGGFYGQGMVAASEPTTEGGTGSSGDKQARYYGGRLGFAAGPFDVAVAAARTKFAGGGSASVPGVTAGDKVTTINVGGSFDFGFAKLLGYAERYKGDDFKEMRFSGSAVIPFGQSEIHVGGDWGKLNPDGGGNNSTIWQAKATYQYNLSKRTAMYATGSWLKNKDDTFNNFIPGGFAGETGGKSRGAELGVRHFF